MWTTQEACWKSAGTLALSLISSPRTHTEASGDWIQTCWSLPFRLCDSFFWSFSRMSLSNTALNSAGPYSQYTHNNRPSPVEISAMAAWGEMPVIPEIPSLSRALPAQPRKPGTNVLVPWGSMFTFLSGPSASTAAGQALTYTNVLATGSRPAARQWAGNSYLPRRAKVPNLPFSHDPLNRDSAKQSLAYPKGPVSKSSQKTSLRSDGWEPWFPTH